ncbi:MAG: ankyrin repeat domain-containing protein [Psychromonas sp.]|nr:ankyrin repeat domain-containing protein [Alteromonadales bacterium]MCP5078485.1 ankyrin repeat domain-containing protein [Psychromonas sp.]
MMGWLKVFFCVSSFIVNCVYADAVDINKEITAAIYSENYDSFSKAYKQVENKDSIMLTEGYMKGVVVSYLFWTIDVKEPSFFDLVVEHSDPNIPDESGLTAIFIASFNCDLDKAQKLIAKGSNINFTLKGSGLTPLHSVATSECYSLANLFLQHGADKKATTNMDKLTPYDMAVKSGYSRMADILKL